MSLKPRQINFDEVWSDLRETVRCVINMEPIKRAVWNERFSDVYSLCVAYPEPLADQLYNETRKYLIQHVINLYGIVSLSNQLLKDYFDHWSHYSTGVSYLHKLYLYLNHQHIRKQKVPDADSTYGSNSQNRGAEQMEIGELGLEIWKDYMIKPLGPRLVKLLIDQINNYRSQKQASDSAQPIQGCVLGCVLSFVHVQEYKKKGALALYQDLFEEPYLSGCVEHYKSLTTLYLSECNVSSYAVKVLNKFAEEKSIANQFLHKSSVAKVEQKCNQHLVIDCLDFLKKESVPLITGEQWPDVANIYVLLKSVADGLKVILDAFTELIKTEGLKLLIPCFSDNHFREFVENVLQIHGKYAKLVQTLFAQDQRFTSALDKACTYVINFRQTAENKAVCRSSELLSRYCDWLLKKSSKDFSETEVDERLSQCITVFKYIDDKDVFQRFYSRMLAKRLIHQLSQSMDAEENMINRLKQACGYEFTNKLHRMFTDMSVSQDLNDKFGTFLAANQHELNVSFFVLVLQAGAWPFSPTMSGCAFVLPPQLERSVQSFEKFYYNHFSGRKLSWLYHLCQVELKLNYLKKAYLVTMQTFQMAILFQFENQDSISYKELQENLQMGDEQLPKHLQSLVDAKLILVKDRAEEAASGDGATAAAATAVATVATVDSSPSNETTLFAPHTVFYLNKSFSNKRTKFRITAAVQKETPQEIEHTVTAVEDDRKLFIQAAIVRIMKARKVMKHNSLIQEILQQSQGTFIPNVSMIKKCIEALIEKQYIERSATIGDEYSYVA